MLKLRQSATISRLAGLRHRVSRLYKYVMSHDGKVGRVAVMHSYLCLLFYPLGFHVSHRAQPPSYFHSQGWFYQTHSLEVCLGQLMTLRRTR